MNKQLRRILIVTLFGVVLYGGFAVYAGLSEIRESLSGFSYWTFVGALGLATLNYLLRFARWQFYLGILEVRGVTWLDSLLIFLSGFVLTITPGKMGEVFKSAVLAKTHGVPPEKTAPIVVAERLTDVVSVVLLILVGSIAFEGGLPWAFAGGVALAIAFTAILWQPPVRWLLAQLERGWLKGVVPQLREAYAQLRRLTSPRMLALPTTLSVVGWGAEGLALWLLLNGFGETMAPSLAAFFYATATLAGALVPVPGGLGVVEALIQEQLIRVAAVSAGAATASMLLIRLATLWWAVLVGFAALGILRVRFKSLGSDDIAVPAS